ncbi:MAG TPA: dTMP kinase [Thermoanaerobaculaceae bacterium]|nr:dTMP kinase [Thermoanaerobaculaceae bacterium]HRS15825.1 dTMP kinase [Thermoanaerobaculaceae bacterium]
MRGRFITFEGIEGCGKSTQHRLLADHLLARGLRVLLTREPGGTPLGEALRAILLDPASSPTPMAELLILEAARAQHVSTLIAPALARGEWVLSDRFADASLAYQGAARGLGLDTVAALNAMVCGATRPDRTLVLDLDVELALERARRRASTTASNRRFEDEDLAFHRTVAEAYRALSAREPERVRTVDASGTPDEVLARVLAAVEDLL